MSSEVQIFINCLLRKGATEGQLNFRDYNSKEFNPSTPTSFRIKRGLRDKGDIGT